MIQTSSPNQTIYKRMRQNFLFETMTILSSDDRSFLTHRLPMAMAAKKVCRTVWVICKDTGKCLTQPIKGKLNLYNFEINPNELNNYSYTKEKNEIYILYE